jgi:hypothetical protein
MHLLRPRAIRRDDPGVLHRSRRPSCGLARLVIEGSSVRRVTPTPTQDGGNTEDRAKLVHPKARSPRATRRPSQCGRPSQSPSATWLPVPQIDVVPRPSLAPLSNLRSSDSKVKCGRRIAITISHEVSPAAISKMNSKTKLASFINLGSHALSICRPGIGSASAVRHAGAPKVSAKYCVSCTTSSCANSMMETEYVGTPS